MKRFWLYIYTSLMVIFLFYASHTSAQPLATGHSKFLGNAVDPNVPPSFDLYWNQVTPGNGGKWGHAEPSRDLFSWGAADNIYAHAKAKGIPFKWHTLVWGNQQPGWIENLSVEEQKTEIDEWYSAIAQRYPDIDFIDVVNEALHDPPNQPGDGGGNYIEALGGTGATGYDWVINAFIKARAFFPNAKLHLNDYNIINSSGATSNYLKLINLLKDRNLIDGIGVQGHRFELENTSAAVLKSNLDKLAATGIPIYITEFDLGNYSDAGTPNDSLQLALYQRIFPVLWEHPGVQGITIWGYIQGLMWQETAFLIRSNGTERPAMEWLRNYMTLSGTFRSFQSGNWNDPATWERYTGTEWQHPAAAFPADTNEFISIKQGHTITANIPVSADQLVIQQGATLTINSGINFSVQNGLSDDLTVNGTMINSGTITLADSAIIVFNSGGKYSHEQDGGVIPTAEWNSGSHIEFAGLVTTAPANTNQNFSNVTIVNDNQSGDINLGLNGNIIGGNLTLQNTGSGRIALATAPAELTIEGDVIISSGILAATASNTPGATATINHNGNMNITGGKLFISGGSSSALWNLNGNISMSNGSSDNTDPEGSKIIFTGGGVKTLNIGTGNTINALPLEVSTGTTLNLGNSILKGSGIFSLKDGSTIQTIATGGIDENIQITGARVLSKAANFNYTGTSAQVTGSLLPDTVNNILINNSAGLTLSGNVTINGILEFKNGALNTGSSELKYGSDGTLKYSATAIQTTSSIEFPETSGPKNLVIANIPGVNLHASRSIEGRLEVAGKLRLGDFDLTAGSATNTGATRFVATNGKGSLKMSLDGTEKFYPVGTNLRYAPVWITNSGVPDSVSIRVEDDETALPEGGKVEAKWFINESAEGSGNYNIKFGWLSVLESSQFRTNRIANAYIFNLNDTTEAGSGEYIRQFTTQPYSVSRGGITELGTFGVGKFGVITDVADDNTGMVKEYSLSQNYPNPFNPTTNFRFWIASASGGGLVTLKIYDILGNEVAVLVNEEKAAGAYEVRFDASGLGSGVYYARLKAGGKSFVRKILLLK